MNSDNQEIKTRTLEEYDLVMSSRKKNKLGIVRLSRLTGIPKDTIRGWLYRGVKPKRLRKTKLLPENSKKLTPELAYILGVIVGDGCLCKSRRHSLQGECYDYVLVLSVTDKDFAEYFKKQVEKWSGFVPYTGVSPPRQKGTKDVFTVRLRSKDAYEFLKSFDLNQLKESPGEIKSMFLKGFFDSEGSVVSSLIIIGVVDKEIISLVRYLLNSLGITYGPLIERKSERYKTYYYFRLASAASLILYKKMIGFSIKRKQNSLEKVCSVKSQKVRKIRCDCGGKYDAGQNFMLKEF